MLKTYHFCNNCGKQGHLFGQCKRPITSTGIIAFRKRNKDIEYLLICRKDSLGYIDFLRGKYPLYNRSYVQTLIDEMSNQEKKKLLEKNFHSLWTQLWGDFVGLQYRGEEKNSKEKFEQIKRGIQTHNKGGYDLKTLIENSKTHWPVPEWGFPKGRRNYQENDLHCALREFREETGFSGKDISVIKNISPFEEIFSGSNFKSYKHKYYLAYMVTGTEPESDFQRTEVSRLKWGNLETCLRSIRPYSLEKRRVISDIDTVLKRYQIIY